MSAGKKLQGEIDACLKRVAEGKAIFDEIWDKVHNASTPAQKEKFEGELKREIKKLQRLREQIKGWIASDQVKDKQPLMDARRAIESDMERFKYCERETKTKAYSKEGLAQAAKADPLQQEKMEVRDWIDQCITDLEAQVDAFESELETLKAKRKGGKKSEREEQLTQGVTRHRYHVKNLELAMRLMENDQVSPSDVNAIKEDVQYYVEANQDPDFREDETVYDQLNLEELAVRMEELEMPTAKGKKKAVMDDSDDEEISTPPAATGSASGGSATTAAPAPAPTPAAPAVAASGKPAAASAPPAAPATAPAAASVADKKKLGAKGGKEEATVVSVASSQPAPAVSTGSAPATARPLQPAASPQKGLMPAPAAAGRGAPSAAAAVLAGGRGAAVLPGGPTAAAVAAGGAPAATSVAQQQQRLATQPQQQQQQQPQQLQTKPGLSAAQVAAAGVSQPPGRAVPGAAGAPTAAAVAAGKPGLVAQPPAPGVSGPIVGATAVPAAQASLPQQQATQPQALPGFPAGANAPQQPQQQQLATAQPPSTTPPPAAGIVPSPVLAPAGLSGQSIIPTSQVPQGAKGPGVVDPRILAARQQQLLVQQAATAAQLQNTLGLGASAQAASKFLQMMRAGSGMPMDDSEGDDHTDERLAEIVLASYHHEHAALNYGADSLRMLEASLKNIPDPIDSERNRQPFDNPALFERLDPDTLFFIFYYQPGTYQQFLAARELKKQGWRFHKKYLTWFQRHEEPTETSSEHEQGTYVYFDYETGWCQRIKSEFMFEYVFLEDELPVPS